MFLMIFSAYFNVENAIFLFQTDSNGESYFCFSTASLKKLYKARKETYISPFPWFEDYQLSLNTIFMNVRMVNRETERSHCQGEDICGMYKIFEPHEKCTDPRVVLLEGEPGIGKTVFCQKIATDWSEGKTSEPFPSFKILLKLKCRDIESSAAIDADTLKKSIADQLLAHEQERLKTGLFNYLEDPESRVLLVLDGLDELNQDIDIFSLIENELRPWKCKFLLTSRNDPKLRKHCDSLFQIIGFTIKDAKSFIRKFLGETDQKIAELLIHKIDDRSSQDGALLRELVSNPLTTSLLCYVCKETNGKLPSGRTNLYQEIIRCILRRYYKKKGEEPPEDPMEERKEDLAALGRLALNGIENGRLHFAESEIPAESRATNILEFGFLSKEASTGFKLSISYQFLHKTFQEFFAALSLSEQLLSGDTACLPSLLQGKYKQVTLFVVGLLSQKPEAAKQIVVDLMSSLTQSVSSSDGSDSFVYVCNVVRECGDNADLERAVCRSVLQHFTWRVLVLISCNLSESSVELRVVCEALKENRPLEELRLSFNKIKDVTSLAQSMESNRTLKVLALPHNPFTDVSALTQSLELNSTLEVLMLDEKFSDESAVKKLKKQNPRLKIHYDW